MSSALLFNSPFIASTFGTTDNRSVYDVYHERIKNIYLSQFPELKEKTPEVIEVKEDNKEDNDKDKEKDDKDKDDKDKEKDDKGKEKEKDNAENEDKNKDKEKEKDDKAAEKDKEDDKDKEKEKDDKDNEKDKDKDAEDDKKEDKKEEDTRSDEQKKLDRALELLSEDYVGIEQLLYDKICKKYNIAECDIESEYVINRYTPPKMSELLRESELVECFECQQKFIHSEFAEDEWNNGIYLACKRCAPDRDNVATCKWHELYKSDSIQLEHDRQVAVNNDSYHRYALMDGKPVMAGIHCWRWKTTKFQSWFLWGISHQKKHNDSSYSQQHVFGIAGSNQSYKNGSCRYDIQTNKFFKNEIIFDMLLDLQKGELKFQIPGDDYVGVMTEIPKDNEEGWVPHVGMYYKGGEVQCKKIPATWFGKNPSRVKFQY